MSVSSLPMYASVCTFEQMFNTLWLKCEVPGRTLYLFRVQGKDVNYMWTPLHISHWHDKATFHCYFTSW